MQSLQFACPTTDPVNAARLEKRTVSCTGGLPVATVLVGVYSLTTGVPFAGVVGYPFDPELSLRYT
jgi:hypothetical protein